MEAVVCTTTSPARPQLFAMTKTNGISRRHPLPTIRTHTDKRLRNIGEDYKHVRCQTGQQSALHMIHDTRRLWTVTRRRRQQTSSVTPFPLVRRFSTRAKAVERERSPADASPSAPPFTLHEDHHHFDEETCYKITFAAEDLHNTLLLDHYKNADGTLDIYVSGVGNDSEPKKAGVKPGQVLHQMSNPMMEGGMWVLGEHPHLFERLRYVKDALKSASSAHGKEITLVLEKEPRITAEMIEQAGPTRRSSETRLTDRHEGDKVSPAEEELAEAYMKMERPDLYSEKWAGGEYTGGRWNDLTVFTALVAIVTTLGVAFAILFKGVLWDVGDFSGFF